MRWFQLLKARTRWSMAQRLRRGCIAHMLVISRTFLFCISRQCLHDKVYKEKRRRSTGQLPGAKNASGPADTMLINRLSTAACVPPSVYIVFRLFVVLEKRLGVFFDASEGTGDTCLLGDLFCRRPILPGSAPLPSRAPRPDPSVVCPVF